MNDNVILARVYQVNDLIGIFPRTKKAGHNLDALLSLSRDGQIDEELKRIYLNEHQNAPDTLSDFLSESNGTLKISRVTSSIPDIFIKLEESKHSEEVIQVAQKLLESGNVRTAEKIYYPKTGKSIWNTQLYAVDCMNALFKRDNIMMGNGFYDKVPLLTERWPQEEFDKRGIRFIPGCFVRAGCYVGPGTTVMPGGIVNSGSYIAGEGVMIDGGSRVATGAQIGKMVKLGAGSGVEGILEPKGTLPTILEDRVRIGANCEVCGIIGEGAAIGSGTVMSKPKKVYDLRTGKMQEPKVIQVGDKLIGVPYVPAGRLAVAGSYSRTGINIGCIVLLEKPASESDFMELPKNGDLYVKI